MNFVDREPRTKICNKDIELATASRRLAYYASDFEEIAKKRPAYHGGRIHIHVYDNDTFRDPGIHIFDIPEKRKVLSSYQSIVVFNYNPEKPISKDNLTVSDFGLDSKLESEILRLAKEIPREVMAFINDRFGNLL